jgi:nucleoside-diphosphate-sugar epimerase
MKIAITGATGGLGRSVAEALLASGFSVVALGRNQSAGADLAHRGARFLAGEITDLAYVSNALKDCDAVVHSAGLASPFGEWSAFFDANVRGTEVVLEAARLCGVKTFIHISTPSIYFTGEDLINIREESAPPVQKSSYGRSKLMADELVFKQAKAQPTVSFALLRPRAIIGPYDTTIIPRMLKVLRRGTFPLPNGGRALIDVTAVENVAHAIQLVLNSAVTFHGEIFNITNQQPMPVRELVSRLADAAGLKPRFLSIPMFVLKPLAIFSEFFARHVSKTEPAISKYAIESIGTSQVLSTEKATRLLGYRPIVSLEDALQNVAKIITQNRSTKV